MLTVCVNIVTSISFTKEFVLALQSLWRNSKTIATGKLAYFFRRVDLEYRGLLKEQANMP